MKRKIKFSVALVCFYAGFNFAQEKTNEIETVVVSETKFPIKKENSGKTIERITQKDLEAKKGQSLAQIINQVAGVDINGANSAAGKNLDYFIRGGRSRQVLVMIDGNPVTDASQPDPVYDLRLIPVEQIESIEIMKGASSVLYGSNASSAVINITLKKSSKKEIQGNAYFQVGTQNTSEKIKSKPQDFSQGLSINGTIGKFNYLTSINSISTKGISQAFGENFENDSFNRINMMQKVGFQPTDKFSLDFVVNYDRVKNAFDAGAFADDSKNNSLTEQVRFALHNKFKYKSGEFHANLGFGNAERQFGIFSSFSNSIDLYYYKSRNINVDAFNKFQFGKNIQTIIGTQFQFMDMIERTAFGSIEKESAKFNMIDPYATFIFNYRMLNLNIGARYNSHSVYGGKPVYNVNPSVYIEPFKLKVLGSVSTAYITPSLYQLYSPYANLDLKPQEDLTAEFGFEKTFFDKKINLFAVGFYRQEKNRFDFFSDNVNFVYQYINIDDIVNARGIEVKLDINPIERLSIQTNYTFTEVENEQVRLIAKHRFNANLGFKISSKISWNTQYQYVDPRKDSYFDSITFSSVANTLDAYQLIHTNFNIEILPKTLNMFVGIHNLLNQEYFETSGYNTLGRNFKVGINLNF